MLFLCVFYGISGYYAYAYDKHCNNTNHKPFHYNSYTFLNQAADFSRYPQITITYLTEFTGFDGSTACPLAAGDGLLSVPPQAVRQHPVHHVNPV
jgi:hypothetical protein